MGNMSVARPPRRRTPLLHNQPHLVANYSMSVLLRVRPMYAGPGRLRNEVDVAAPRIKDATSSLLRAYPGPLQGRKLHKDKIISFCKEQIRLGPSRSCSILYATQTKPLGSVDKYRASHALMWNLLILLLRQNGVSRPLDLCRTPNSVLTLSYPFPGHCRHGCGRSAAGESARIPLCTGS